MLKSPLFATKEAYCCSLARHGELQLLDAFRYSPDLCALAKIALTAGTQGGHLDVVKWACCNMSSLPHASKTDWLPWEVAAAQGGMLAISQWMGYKYREVSDAVARGHLEYITSEGALWKCLHESFAEYCVAGGIIQLVAHHRRPSPTFFCYCGVNEHWYSADHVCSNKNEPLQLCGMITKEERKHAKALHLSTLWEVYAHRDDWISEIANEAAAFGHLYILKWFHAHRELFGDFECEVAELAVQHEHLHILRWLKTAVPAFFESEVTKVTAPNFETKMWISQLADT